MGGPPLLRSVQGEVTQAGVTGPVGVMMSVTGRGERETNTHLGSDWDTVESFLKNGRAKIHLRPGDVS